GNGSLLAPGPNVPVSSIHLFVGGNIVKFGHRSNTSAILYQPNGTLRLGRFNSFKGQFIAKVIRSDFGDAFTLYSCGNGIVDPGEQCDPGPTGDNRCCDPSCFFKSAGTDCDDGNPCNGSDTCSAHGQCVQGTPPDCNPENQCKTFGCDKDHPGAGTNGCW